MEPNEKPLNAETLATPPADSPPKPSAPTRGRFPRWAVVALAVLVVFVGLTAYVYTRPPTDPGVRQIVGLLPYPAVIVNGEMVRMSDFLIERDALTNYFQMTTGATDPSTAPSEEELSVSIVDTLVNKKAIEQLADERDITLDEDRVETVYQEAVTPAGGEEVFAQQLDETFGWTTRQFRERVVESVVLALQLSEAISNDAEIQAESRTQIDAALARVNAGEDFGTVAGEVSQDFTAAQGGDLGYVTAADLPTEWVVAVDALQIGGNTAVLETEESYVIFKLTDRIEGDALQYKLSAILVHKKTLKEVVEAYLEEASVWRFVGEV